MALHYAAQTENIDDLKKILQDTKVTVAVADKDGLNAIHYAAWYSKKSTETLSLLLAHPTCTSGVYNKKNGLNDTPLDIAYNNYSNNVKKEIIDILKKKGCKTSLELEGHEILSRVKYEDYSASQMTPDFASLDKNGCNCLHFAAYHNYENTDILESLLSHNTCHIEHINKKAFDGLTPLDYAIQFNSFPTQQSFIDVLRKHGAKTSVEIDGNNSSANDFKNLNKKQRKKIVQQQLLEEEEKKNDDDL